MQVAAYQRGIWPPPHWIPHQCLKPGVARAAKPRAAGWIRQIALSPDQPRP